MPVEFISASFANASNDLNPLPDAPVDPLFLERYARALDDYGFNYTLIPYSSASFDPFTSAQPFSPIRRTSRSSSRCVPTRSIRR